MKNHNFVLLNLESEPPFDTPIIHLTGNFPMIFGLKKWVTAKFVFNEPKLLLEAC